MGNEIKIVIGGDASSLVQANNQANASVDALQKTIVTASNKIDAATNSIRHSFDEVAAGKAAMDRISASIDKMADEALKAGGAIEEISGKAGGARFPLANIDKFREAVGTLKSDLQKGVIPQNIEAGFNKISTGAGQAHVSLNQLKPGANQAANALTNLSRVAQDAPFGFIGIQNNLNPLLESFGRLKQETGSSRAAFKALASSLAGPAGVGLALGVVTGLITAAIQKYGSLGNAFDALFSSTNAAAQAQRDIAKAFAEGEGKAAGEIASVNALLKVARDESLSKEARTEAINKLNTEYDKYLPKLTEENINTKEVTDSVDKLTKSLIRQAQIRGLQDLISKETSKQAESFANTLGDNASVVDNLVAGLKSLSPAGNFFNEQTIAGAKRTGEAYQESQKRIETFQKFLDSLTKDEANAGTLFDEKKLKKGEDALKKRIAAIKQLQSSQGLDEKQQVELAQLEIKLVQRDFAKLGFSKKEAQDQIQGILEKAFPVGTFEFDTVVTTRINKLEFSKIQKPEILSKDQVNDIAKATGNETIELQAPKFEFVNVEDKTKAALDQLNKSIQSISTGAMESFAAGLGEAIAGKGDIFSSLFTILGDGLQQLGKALLAYGLALVGFKVALKSLNPVVAIAAGALAIAAGAALKASIPKFADGGIATRATLGIFGEAGKEAIIPLDRLPELLGRINVNNQNDVALAPTLRISLTDLELGLERVRSKRRRLG